MPLDVCLFTIAAALTAALMWLANEPQFELCQFAQSACMKRLSTPRMVTMHLPN